MGNIRKIEKITSNPYVNLYDLDVENSKGHAGKYYVSSRAKSADLLELNTKQQSPDGVVIYTVYRPASLEVSEAGRGTHLSEGEADWAAHLSESEADRAAHLSESEAVRAIHLPESVAENAHRRTQDLVVLIRQYRYAIDNYIYEFPAGLIEAGEDYHTAAVRELREETGLTLHPLSVDTMYEKPYYTTIGMTDECCATVYGYADGTISADLQEASEEIEVVLADRDEVRRILREERVAIMCAYMLMHFLEDEEPFGFLHSPTC
ncbi:MAG: NUDIX hydrolase [Lachnospiraceae bacterium]|nr:NUDIX hydrolase [Lachnospiraceae bacterium]